MTEIKLTKRVKYAGDVFKELTEKAGFPIDLAADFLNNIPDADGVPAVHGQWEKRDKIIVCAGEKGCYEAMRWNFYTRGKCFEERLPAYCPFCGAKMDGGASDG